MAAFLVNRILASLFTAFLSTVVVFLLIHAVPGDIVQQMLGQSANNPEAVETLRGFFGLDQPLPVQYWHWLSSVLTGDLGMSWNQGIPVAGLIFSAFGVTLEVALLALLIAPTIGVPLGFLAAVFERRWADQVVQGFNVLGLSIPMFWLGLILLIGASWAFSWSPPLVFAPPWESLSDNLSMMVLPVLSLTLLQVAVYSQFSRQMIVWALREPYVATAEAKGLAPRVIMFKHVLRNVMIPISTSMGLVLIEILGGEVVIETLFALPGIGRLLVTSIQNRDYPIVQGALLLLVFVALLINLIVDVLYHYIDPRVRN